MSAPPRYRVIHPVHIGGAEPPTQLTVNEIVLFDGKILRREDGSVVKIPQPDSFRGAIKIGWIVLEASEETEFRPKSAGVEVHSASSTGSTRERINVMTVADEERDIGHITKVRPEGAPAMHSAKNAGDLAETPTKPVRRVIRSEDGDDGRVVGRMKLSAKSEAVEVGKGDDKIRNQLDNGGRHGVERVARATGDVQTARAGETLPELLPDAVSTGTPEPGIFADEGVSVGSGGSSVGGVEEGRVIGTVAKATPRTPPADPVAALRKWSEKGESWDDQPVTTKDLQLLTRTVIRKLDSYRSAAHTNVAQASALEAAPAPTAANTSGNFQWDTSTHWKTRVKIAQEHRGDAGTLQRILAAEDSTGVKKAVQKMIDSLA